MAAKTVHVRWRKVTIYEADIEVEDLGYDTMVEAKEALRDDPSVLEDYEYDEVEETRDRVTFPRRSKGGA